MILCWLFTYSYCPALICLWERLRKAEAPARSRTPRLRLSARRPPSSPTNARCWRPSARSRCWPPGRSRPLVREPVRVRLLEAAKPAEPASTAPAISMCGSGRSFRRTWRRWGSRLLPRGGRRAGVSRRPAGQGLRRRAQVRARPARRRAHQAGARSAPGRVAAGEPTGGLLSSVADRPRVAPQGSGRQAGA